MVLNKNDIINGKDAYKDVHIKSLDGEIRLRPITSREWQTIQEVESKGLGKFRISPNMNAKNPADMVQAVKGEIDLGKLSKHSFNAKVKTLVYSMSYGDEKWNEDEITKNLTPLNIDEIYNATLKISGIPVTEDQATHIKGELEKFPGNSGGSADSPE